VFLFIPKTSAGVRFIVDDIEVHLCQLRAITDLEASQMLWLVSDTCVLT
jgi:hypothetical protein